MKKEKKKIEIPASIIIFLLVCAAAFSVGGLYYYISLDDENVTIEGKIIDVGIKEDEMYIVDILVITFDNGKTYYVENTLGNDVDFTVNSKFIIKMYRPDTESYWVITQIYRVPG